MMKTVPPLNDLFNMAGLNLPSYLKGENAVETSNPSTEDKSSETDTEKS
jgi:flotillin